MLILGGILFLFIDKLFNDEKASNEAPTYKKAFIIGVFQCISMIPGVSRSAATIIGGLTQGLNRKAAAEFSFFLAVPTMFAATAKKALDFYTQNDGIFLNTEQIKLLAVGNIVAFIVAMIAIKSFIAFLTKHGFKLFGYYRIVAGALILLMVIFGFQLKF
jgi:undecaprenyl-diphosphatase